MLMNQSGSEYRAVWCHLGEALHQHLMLPLQVLGLLLSDLQTRSGTLSRVHTLHLATGRHGDDTTHDDGSTSKHIKTKITPQSFLFENRITG